MSRAEHSRRTGATITAFRPRLTKPGNEIDALRLDRVRLASAINAAQAELQQIDAVLAIADMCEANVTARRSGMTARSDGSD